MRRFLLIPTAFLFFVLVIKPVYSQTTGRMYFEKSSLEVQNSAEFVTKIYIDTSGADVAGSDVIINFNPVFLKATKVEPGLIFDDYPLAAIDSEKGIVSVSGVSGSVDNLFNGDDVVAKITWQAQKTGITEVSFDFTESACEWRATSVNVLLT